MRANRVEVEKISVPQAEIKTAGVIIALKTLKLRNVSCMICPGSIQTNALIRSASLKSFSVNPPALCVITLNRTLFQPWIRMSG